MRIRMKALLACSGMALSASPGIGAMSFPACCVWQNGTVTTMELEVGYTVTGTVTSATAGGAVLAGAFDWEIFSVDEDNGCGSPPEPTSDFEAEADGPLSLGSLSLYADAESNFWGAEATAEISYGASSGHIRMENTSGAGTELTYNTSCLVQGYEGLGLAIAVGEVDADWTFSGLYTFVPYVQMTARVTIYVPNPECPDCGPMPTQGELDYVQFFSIETVRGGTHEVTQGVYYTDEEGNVTRLGFFTDSAFDPDAEDDGFSVNSGPVSLGAAPGTGQAVTATVHQDSFADFDGNMDPADGDQVCWTDREIIRSLIGTSINDIDYTPRADFDLDGDIDVADMALFNDIGCTADVDCSGGLTFFDYTSFQNLYSAQDPAADIEGDGDWDYFDYLEFQNVYNAGCP